MKNKTRVARSLRGLGFQALTASVHWCRGGELIHVVDMRGDRHGNLQISPCVWHSSFAAKGETFSPDAMVSPISGMLSPQGVINSWSWREAEPDDALVAELISNFFVHFHSLGDVRRALEDEYVRDNWEKVLANPVARPDIDQQVQSVATYAVDGGQLSLAETRRRLGSCLGELVQPLGFELAPSGSDLIATRDRGELIDCVQLLPDLFGTFVSVLCFPWTTKVWSVDRRWKGTYYSMCAVDVVLEGRPALLPIAELPEKIDALRASVVKSLEEVRIKYLTASDFLSGLGSDWSSLASQLRRVI